MHHKGSSAVDPHTLHINPLLFGCPDCTARLCMHCIQPSAIAGTLSGLQYLWPEQEGSNWATPQQPLGQVLYDTYTEEDYHIIWETYSYSDFSWDFGKLNSSAAKPRHSRLSPTITKVYKQQVTQVLTPSNMPLVHDSCYNCSHKVAGRHKNQFLMLWCGIPKEPVRHAGYQVENLHLGSPV